MCYELATQWLQVWLFFYLYNWRTVFRHQLCRSAVKWIEMVTSSEIVINSFHCESIFYRFRWIQKPIHRVLFCEKITQNIMYSVSTQYSHIGIQYQWSILRFPFKLIGQKQKKQNICSWKGQLIEIIIKMNARELIGAKRLHWDE